MKQIYTYIFNGKVHKYSENIKVYQYQDLTFLSRPSFLLVEDTNLKLCKRYKNKDREEQSEIMNEWCTGKRTFEEVKS